jgi:hypothetical protein
MLLCGKRRRMLQDMFRMLLDHAARHIKAEVTKVKEKTTIPGFTAEASLDRTTRAYRANAHQTQYSGGSAVIPQIRKLICSDDGTVCFDCFYTDNDELLYCDVYLPA